MPIRTVAKSTFDKRSFTLRRSNADHIFRTALLRSGLKAHNGSFSLNREEHIKAVHTLNKKAKRKVNWEKKAVPWTHQKHTYVHPRTNGNGLPKRKESVWLVSTLDLNMSYVPRLSHNKRKRNECSKMVKKKLYGISGAHLSLSGLWDSEMHRQFSFVCAL